MKAVNTLPEKYTELYAIDLQKDKKLSLLVNLIAVLIAVLLAVPMHFCVPIYSLLDMTNGFGAYMIRYGVLIGAMFAYIVLHELVHGVAMKICGTKKIKYGFTGLYAYAGSDDYYDKKSYLFIALAPVVLWGVVLAILNPLVPIEWFWVVYLIQITNLSGAAGDLFVTVKFSRFPNDILIKDHGVGMTVYSESETER